MRKLFATTALIQCCSLVWATGAQAGHGGGLLEHLVHAPGHVAHHAIHGVADAAAHVGAATVHTAGAAVHVIGRAAGATIHVVGRTAGVVCCVAHELVHVAGDVVETVYCIHPVARVGRHMGILPRGKLGILPSHGPRRVQYYSAPVHEYQHPHHDTADEHQHPHHDHSGTHSHSAASRPVDVGRAHDQYTLVSHRTTPSADSFDTGLRHFWEGDFGRAVKAFERAAAAQPGDVTPRYFLALSYLRSGQKVQAEAALASAVRAEAGNWGTDPGRMLQRVQGQERTWLESARRKAGVGPY